MRHLTDGTLRRLVDEPAGVADADREHAAGCPVCLSGLAAAQRDAALVGAALGPGPATPADPGVDAAWRRLTVSLTDGERPQQAPSARTPGSRARRRQLPRVRSAVRSPVVAAVGVLALVTGAGAAAAGDWLQIFHTEQVAPIAVSAAEVAALAELPDLTAYGEVEVLRDVEVREVTGAAAAEEATGLSAPSVGDLPRGVTGKPVYQVVDEAGVVFTFSAEAAAQAAKAAGEPAPPPPPGLDGSRFRLTAGPGVAAVWSGTSGLPALVAARAVAPAVDSSGVSFETARDYLLALPGLPGDVASQLRRLSGDGTTLPLIVPADEATASTADVGGATATVVTSRDGTMAAVVWVDDGTVTAVAGSLSAAELLTVARALR